MSLKAVGPGALAVAVLVGLGESAQAQAAYTAYTVTSVFYREFKKDGRFFVAAVGVDTELRLTPRRDVEFQQINPLTGARQPPARLAAGASTTLKAAGGVILLDGRLTAAAK